MFWQPWISRLARPTTAMMLAASPIASAIINSAVEGSVLKLCLDERSNSCLNCTLVFGEIGGIQLCIQEGFICMTLGDEKVQKLTLEYLHIPWPTLACKAKLWNQATISCLYKVVVENIAPWLQSRCDPRLKFNASQLYLVFMKSRSWLQTHDAGWHTSNARQTEAQSMQHYLAMICPRHFQRALRWTVTL
jgi:hypothetical protein